MLLTPNDPSFGGVQYSWKDSYSYNYFINIRKIMTPFILFELVSKTLEDR